MCRSRDCGGRRCEPDPDAGRAAAARYYQRSKARAFITRLASDGICAHDDLTMPTTFHRARDHGSEALTLRPTEIGNQPLGKPTGALWTSPGRTLDGGAVQTGWTDWSYSNTDTQPRGTLAAVEARPGAVVVRIDTAEDAAALAARYPTASAVFDLPLSMDGKFDWVAMQRDGIHGVYLTRAGVSQVWTDHDGPIGQFYGWDASSVAWLSTERLEVTGARPAGRYGEQAVARPPLDEGDRPGVPRVPARFAAAAAG